MKPFLRMCLPVLCFSAGVLAQEKPQAFVGAAMLPIGAPEIPDGVLVVHLGKITALGPAGSTVVPEDAERHDVSGKIIMPGLVDTHSHVGEVEGADSSAPIQPEVRVLDSIDVRDASIQKAQAGGITTANVMPGSGHLISGQTLYLKLRDGDVIDDLLIYKDDGGIAGGLKMANGTNSRDEPPFPGTRAKSAALVREQFIKAQEYRNKIELANGDPEKAPARDLAMEALVEVLNGQRTVHHHTHRHDDILTVLRLAEEFGFKVVLQHVTEAWRVADEIAAAEVPSSIIVIDSPGGKLEAVNLSLFNGAALEEAGAPVGFHTDDPITDSRLFLRSAALAVRGGMSRRKALEGLTITGARMLDLEDRVGSLQAGKDADFIVLSGDPLSVYTKVLETWVDGIKVFDKNDPQDQLYAVGGYGAGKDPQTGSRPEAHPEGTLLRLEGGASYTQPAPLNLPGSSSSSQSAGSSLRPQASGLRPPTAVHAQLIYTMAGEPISDGVILIRDGKIESVGSAAEITVPDEYETISATVVTPGLIDAHTVVGLAGYLNQPHDQDQLEDSAPVSPQLRAIDAYNAREPLVEWIRSLGVTVIHTGHGPGALISGQTMIAKTRGETVQEAVIVPTAMVAATLGSGAREGGGKSPGTRAKMIAMLRSEFLKAQDYSEKQDSDELDQRPSRDLGMETLARVLKRELPFLVTVHAANDIMSALRLAQEFNIRLVLDGASESYLLADQIKEAGVPVIVHPTMFRSDGDLENLSMETPARLKQAGILMALQSGYESYVPKTRVVLFEAGIAAANGLSREEALASVTIDAAELLGIADRVGSLEPGKDADLVLFDGDPFEYTTHVMGVVIDGEVVSEGR
ncbi:MAG: amidohydrolase family protein [Acidobacteriota bacterium]